MAEISRFYGIIIYMYFKDHIPAHLHAKYAEDNAKIDINTGEIIDGYIPNKQLKLIQAWVEIHKDELLANFISMNENNGEFKKINPLI